MKDLYITTMQTMCSSVAFIRDTLRRDGHWNFRSLSFAPQKSSQGFMRLCVAGFSCATPSLFYPLAPWILWAAAAKGPGDISCSIQICMTACPICTYTYRFVSIDINELRNHRTSLPRENTPYYSFRFKRFYPASTSVKMLIKIAVLHPGLLITMSGLITPYSTITPSIYTVTMSIEHKVLLHTSLQVPFGWLAELQLTFMPSKWYTWSSNFQETFPRT